MHIFHKVCVLLSILIKSSCPSVIHNLNMSLSSVGCCRLLKARIRALAGDDNCTAESAEQSMEWTSSTLVHR